jgi:hypothetical protein
MLILAVNMKEALLSFRGFGVRGFISTSGIKLFHEVREYLDGKKLVSVGSHSTDIFVPERQLVGQEFDHSFAKRRATYSILVYGLECLKVKAAFQGVLGKDSVHDTVLQHGYLESIAKYPKLKELSPVQGLIVLGSELTRVEPGMEVLKHLLLDIEQIDLLISGFDKRSVQGCAEVVGVEHQ